MSKASPTTVSAFKPSAPASTAFGPSAWGALFDLSKWGFASPDLSLSQFDLPYRSMVPVLSSLRQINTAADVLFYDVFVLCLRLMTHGITVTTADATSPDAAKISLAALQAAAKIIDLGALANPEGAILVVDAHRPPFVERYDDVREFLDKGLTFPAGDAADPSVQQVRIASVTGVGSSALGSAAFAWNISESLREPVAAIVPGYGLADMVSQGLGGWFGFGLHDYLRRWTQQALVEAAPQLAAIGRRLPSTVLGDEAFRSGSPESDVLHHILLRAPQIRRLYGHSKGALCIQNAVRGLPATRYDDLHVTTFGCVVQEETAADYNQIMGDIDGLGQLNSWGNWPERWIKSWHSTNTMLPLTMPVADLVKQDVRDEDPVAVDPDQLQSALEAALKAVLPPHLLAPDRSAQT